MNTPLLNQSERLQAAFPTALIEAERLLRLFNDGRHGRRKAGPGSEFWQYRAALPGDSLRHIDWRRSAKTEEAFIVEREWEGAQALQIWPSQAASMQFSSKENLPSKAERAKLLTLAALMMIMRSGERGALMGADMRFSSSEAGLHSIASALESESQPAETEYASLPSPTSSRGIALVISDCFAEESEWEIFFDKVRSINLRGVLFLLHDPAEQNFPYKRPTLFEAMLNRLSFLSARPASLREAYLNAFLERGQCLQTLAKAAGWKMLQGTTEEAAAVQFLRLRNLIVSHTRSQA